MRIVRPYGASSTDFDANNRLRRQLRAKAPPEGLYDLPDFARSHAALVIAQWISVIDKIARKPVGKQGATQAQRALRQKLGQAAWDWLGRTRRLSAGDCAQLEARWWQKVHPYGDAPYRARRNKQGEKLPDPDARGRWYAAIVGDVMPEQINARAIAAAIDDHLYGRAIRLHPDVAARKPGLIEARAASIEGSVMALADQRRAKNRIALPEQWSDADEARYFASHDIAREIHDDALAQAEADRPYRLSAAAKLLEAHGQRIFGAGVTRFREVPEADRGLLALHQAVRETYRSKLKRRAKPSVPKDGKAPRQLHAAHVLPRNQAELMELTGGIGRNRDLADLIRRGKLIHYTAAKAAGDTPGAALTHWPTAAELEGSHCRTSDGQAEIKRAEAFVRHWRHTIALAALTLRDWASMKKGDIGDVLGSSSKLDEAVGQNNFDASAHDSKVALLFGNRAGLFGADDAARKALLQSVIRIGIELRNTSFHFKGLDGFLKALESLGSARVEKFGTQKKRVLCDPSVLEAARKLWETDCLERAARLRATLVAVDAGYYFDAPQNRQLLGLLEAKPSPVDLPIPRFRRVLHRADGTWKGKQKLILPPPVNRGEMDQKPALRCRYVCLKMLYERPFRAWFSTCDRASLNQWIRQALARTSEAAKTINGNKDAAKRALITSRAEDLVAGKDWEITDFLRELSAATAGEMRVQRGYGHDGDAAREQAGFIDDLLCDVVALALQDWLRDTGLPWLTALDPDTPLPGQPVCDLDGIETPPATDTPEDWEAALYLFLHLVPVGEASRLLHQFAKWQVTTTKAGDAMTGEDEARLTCLKRTLILHLDMHDAKFEGGAALTGCEPFAGLFASRPGFSRIFPASPDAMLDSRVPKRGLREIMRFGHRRIMAGLAGDKITDREVDDFLTAEADTGTNGVAALQARREDLHAQWVDKKTTDLRAYVEAVCGIAVHRRLATRVTLVDLVESHRLLMAVLGRLVDYSGLFERDLYFATLGFVHRSGWAPDLVFDEAGRGLLANGQIFAAFRDVPDNGDTKAATLKAALQRLFGDPAGCELFGGKGTLQQLRNDFAHFNWLHDATKPLDLTAITNDARRLMSYDRKLRNAVSKSIVELLARDGFGLSWSMSGHALDAAKIIARQARHLDDRKLCDTRRKQTVFIEERLKSPPVLRNAATLFSGSVTDSPDITDWDLSAMDWSGPRRNMTANRRKLIAAGSRKTRRTGANATEPDASFGDIYPRAGR